MSIVEDIMEERFDKERAVYKKRIEELEEFRTKANARIHRLSDALEEIVYRYESRKMCNCDPHGHYVCDCCIAKQALEAKP